MTDAKILKFPTPTTRLTGALRAATNGPHALAPAPWRLETWPAEDGYPARLWVRLDDELDATQARALAAQLLQHAERL